MSRTIRDARQADYDDIAAFTGDTWADEGVEDYLPDIFPRWLAKDDDNARTVVAEVEDTVVGLCRGTILADGEGWLSGMRVQPAHRGQGHGRALTETLFSWCRDRGSAVARNMSYDWNEAGLGQSRAVGFDPVTSVRVAEPDPTAADPDPTAADPDLPVTEDRQAGWEYWRESVGHDRLAGLAFDPHYGWALSTLSRARLVADAVDDRVLVVGADEPSGVAVAIGARERAGTETAWWAIAEWDGPAACEALFDAIRADGAERGVDQIRVPVHDSPARLGDLAAAEIGYSGDAMLVNEATLTD